MMPGCTRIHVQMPGSGILHDLENMGMTTDDNSWMVFIDHVSGMAVVGARIAGNMGHEDVGAIDLEDGIVW